MLSKERCTVSCTMLSNLFCQLTCALPLPKSLTVKLGKVSCAYEEIPMSNAIKKIILLLFFIMASKIKATVNLKSQSVYW